MKSRQNTSVWQDEGIGTEMANLRVTFGGMKMRNPIGVAALNPAIAYARTATVQADWLMRHVEAGAGYIYVSATRPQPSSPAEANPALKWLKIQCPGFANKESLFTTGDISATQFYLDKTLEVMSIIKKKLPKDVPIIAQPHVAGADIKEWVHLCRVFEEAGANWLELNVACPISLIGYEVTDPAVKLIEEVDTLEMRTLRKLGLTPSMGEIPEVMAPITKACVEAVKIPVGVKPSAEAGFPKCVALAKLAADAGAKWVTNITSPISVAPPKIYDRGKTPWDIVGFPINPLAGVSGPNNRYQCYKDTVTIALFVPEIDICAVGGLVNAEHCVEVLMMGAKTLGLSSGFFWKGRKLITDSVKFLNRFMVENGYEKIEDLIGIGLAYVKPVNDTIDWKVGKIAAEVDKEKCVRCGVCSDGFCPVPVKGADDFPLINKTNCQGCGYCVAICPAGALSIVNV